MSEIPQPIDRETAREYTERQRQICEILRVNDITSASQINPAIVADVLVHLITCSEDVPHKPISGLPDLGEY